MAKEAVLGNRLQCEEWRWAGCWGTGGRCVVSICIWGEAFTFVGLGRYLELGKQWECVGLG